MQVGEYSPWGDIHLKTIHLEETTSLRDCTVFSEAFWPAGTNEFDIAALYTMFSSYKSI